MPTLNPFWANATAKLTVKEDFPTPPLPDAIANTLVFESGRTNGISRSGPRNCNFNFARCSSLITSSSTITFETPSILETAFSTLETIDSRIGQALIVRKTATVTSDPFIEIDLTMPSSVIGLWISGSSTVSRDLRTFASVSTCRA